MTWRASVLTLFPEMFPGPLGQSLAGRALASKTWSLDAVQLRDFAAEKHRTVDEPPFGGGAGMVMRPDVVAAALASVEDGRPRVYLTPRGRRLTQADLKRFAGNPGNINPGIIVLCGRYEGVDQRAIEAGDWDEISLGDYVLSGGEPACLVLLDGCVRLLPGVMGAPESGLEESFSAGLLEYPHYTRPADWQGRLVPDVLLSGNHAAIAGWRQGQSETATKDRRPDLWAAHVAKPPVAIDAHRS